MVAFASATSPFVELGSRHRLTVELPDEPPPRTERCPAFRAEAPAVNAAADEEEEPPTLRSDEIRAASPRAVRTFDPATHVIDAPVEGEPVSRVRPSPANGASSETGRARAHRSPRNAAGSMGARLRSFAERVGSAVEHFVA